MRWITSQKYSFVQFILSMQKVTGSDVHVLTVNVDI